MCLAMAQRRLLQKAASFHAMCCLLIAVTHHVSLVLAAKDLIGWQGETHTVSDDVEDTNAAAEAEELMKLRSSLAGKIGPQAGGSPATRHDVTHHDAVVTTSFVVGPKPKHPSHHASTIVELDSPKHLLVAWLNLTYFRNIIYYIIISVCHTANLYHLRLQAPTQQQPQDRIVK